MYTVNIKTPNSGMIKGPQKKCYNVLGQPFLRECRSLLKDMVVAYNV